MEKKNILLVEDEALIGMMQISELEKCGYSVQHIMSGEEAVDYVNQNSNETDLILMDIDLGKGIDGTEAARQILSNHSIPLVFLSSHTEPEIVKKTEKITSYGYVVKNSGITVLDASIKMAFKLFNAKQKIEEELRNRTIIEEKLIIQEKRSRTWLQESPICTKIIGKDLNLQFMSDAGFKMLNLDSETEVYGKPYPFSFFPESFSGEMRRAIEESGKSSKITYYEGCTYNQEKKEIWLSSTIVPILDDSGDLEYFIVFSIDVSTAKVYARQLEQVLEATTEGIWSWDFTTNTLSFSDNYYRMLGYKPGEFPASYESWVSLLHPEDRNSAIKVAEEYLETKPDTYHNSFRMLKKDGSDISVLSYAKVVERDGSGNALYMVGNHTDFTEIHNLKNKLKKQSDNYYRLFNEHSAVKLLIDPDTGRIVDVNKAALRYYGYSKEEMLNINISQINCLSPQEIETEMQRAQKNSKVYFEFKHRLADGQIRDVCVFSNGIVLDGKDLLHSIIFDITEQKRLENKYAWLRDSEISEDLKTAAHYNPEYSNVTELNTSRLILDNVGIEKLSKMADDVMALLDTSLAVYEKNGDYAFGVFKSIWCQILDHASYKLCDTSDTSEALNCGRWLCHENCWNDSAKAAMQCESTTDIKCVGDIHLYAVPIRANNEIIGVVNIGYGNPPQSEAELKVLSKKFQIDYDILCEKSRSYKARPEYIIELGKKRCEHMAQLIGEEVENALKSKQLTEVADEYKNLIKNLNEGYLFANESGIITMANDAVVGMLEYDSSSDLIGRHMQEVYAYPEKRDPIMGDLMQQKNFSNYEFIFKTKTGKLLETSCNIKLKFDDDGEFIGTEGLIRDITELKKAQRDVNKFKEIIENANHGFSITDFDGNIQYINQYMAHLLEYEPEYLIGKNLEILHSKDDLVHVQESLSKVFNTGSMQDVEIVHKTKSGKKIPMLASGIVLEDSITKQKYLGATAINLSSIKEKEKIIVKSKNKFENLLMMLPSGFFMADKNGYLIMANQTIAQMSGYDSPNEMIGKHMKEFYMKQESRDDMLTQLKAQGKLNNYRIILKRKDGSLLPTSSNIRMNYDESGNYISTEALVRDLSEIEKLQKILKEKNSLVKSILNVLPGSLNVVDKDFNLILSNKENHLLKKESSIKNLGHKCYEIYQHQNAPCKWCNITDVFETGNEYSEITEDDDPRVKITGKNWKVVNKPIFDEAQNVIGVIEYGTDITELKRAEQYAKKQLKENELLIRESHHRIKNNITSIQNLLKLQVEKEDDKKVKQALNKAVSRVASINALYEKLSFSQSFNTVNTKPYLDDLIKNIILLYPNIQVQTINTIDDFVLDSNIITSIGIIVNEFITNSIKHAFSQNGKGKITTTLQRNKDNITLLIRDNGPGLPEPPANDKDVSIGLELIRLMAHQLEAELKLENENGVKLSIEFKMSEK